MDRAELYGLPNLKVITSSHTVLRQREECMSRTPIPDNLIHKHAEVEENAKLFDTFASLLEITPSLVELTRKELQTTIASNLVEMIRRKVSEDGEVKLPFGLIIKQG